MDGTFFLGGALDPASGDRTGDNVAYESDQLTTHGVIVGMTGSGKTGLGVIVLEEALRSGIPVLAIDPKGDMGNLLLNFPSFAPAEFEPWVDEGEANRKGISVSQLATDTADMWKNGLASWELGSAEMQAIKDGSEFDIYTPGSSAGIGLNVVGSLNAPKGADEESLLEEIEGFVSSLLVLAGLDPDPLSSREHILLSNIIQKAWEEGRDLDLASLIGQVQEPPLRKLGVFELDSFFPPKDRTKLAMTLNGLVASPAFGAWMKGVPVDIQSMLYTPDGKPKASVVYLPHLSETERQFVVTLMLSKVVTWMRSQPGTSELRAIIYMDEVFGFAPPTAEPPSKKPILTILKQARAHGVGMVLSTQNPVDLDYKAMSNAGTWMVGRLQTERDKARILEGMTSASGDVDVDAFDTLISDLGKRQFVLHTVKAGQPSLFTTRWAMSFLRGPLTKDEVGTLMAGRQPAAAASSSPAAGSDGAAVRSAPVEAAENETPVAPTVPDSVPVYYLDPAAPWSHQLEADPTATTYAPGLAARVSVTFDDQYAKVDHDEEWEAVFHPLGERFEPEAAVVVDYDDRDLRPVAPESILYRLPEAPIDTAAFFRSAQTELKDHLYRSLNVQIKKNPTLKIYSRVGETAEDFAARCEDAAEEASDEELAKLRDKYETKVRRAQEMLATAERQLREAETSASGRKQQEVMSGAGDLLGMFLGGRRRSRSLSGAASRRAQTRKAEERVRSAEGKVMDRQDALADLEDELEEDVIEITSKWEDVAAEIEDIEIGLEKTDIKVDDFALVWIPVSS